MKNQLTLDNFRHKFNFTINYNCGGFNVDHLIGDNRWYDIDFDVFLPTKGVPLQRPFVWTLEQKQELIISILKGVSINSITVIQYKDDTPENKERPLLKIIDGKQRLSTLIDFVQDKFTIILDDVEYAYSEFDPYMKLEINSRALHINMGYEYHDTPISDDDKIAWFEQINFAGTAQDVDHITMLKSK